MTDLNLGTVRYICTINSASGAFLLADPSVSVEDLEDLGVPFDELAPAIAAAERGRTMLRQSWRDLRKSGERVIAVPLEDGEPGGGILWKGREYRVYARVNGGKVDPSRLILVDADEE